MMETEAMVRRIKKLIDEGIIPFGTGKMEKKSGQAKDFYARLLVTHFLSDCPPVFPFYQGIPGEGLVREYILTGDVK
jgi:hypothetical protein